MATLDDVKPGCRLKVEDGYVSVSYVFNVEVDGVKGKRVLGIQPKTDKGRIDMTVMETDPITVIPYSMTEEI